MFSKLEHNTPVALGLRLVVVILLFVVVVLSSYLVFTRSYHYQYAGLETKEFPISFPVKIDQPSVSLAPLTYTPVATTSMPILYYHHIRHYNNPSDKTGEALSVTPEKFREQMRWLFDRHYVTITPEQLLQLFNGHLILPLGKKPAMVSFDDGYDNMLTEAYPILKEFNFTGLFFVCPGLLNKPGYLTTQQVKFLDKNGMSFGGHTMTHVDLKQADDATRLREIKGSKDELETLLGHAVISMAYPFGMFNDKTEGITRKVGYTISMSTLPGLTNNHEDWLALTRVRMYQSKDLSKVLP